MKRDQIDQTHAEDLYAAILQLETAEEVESFSLICAHRQNWRG